MALKQPAGDQGRVHWHFLVRLGGFTGLLLVGLGLVFYFLAGLFVGLVLLIVGGLLAGLSLVGEVLGAVEELASRRGARGGSALAQFLLAVLLVVGLNLFSFGHYQRWDCTRNRLFTIPEELRDKLSRLQGQTTMQGQTTTIVLHLRHVTAGQLSEKLDEADAAAERKVVEKVKDLTEQFQELGPRFKVWVLDVQEHGYEDKLKKVTGDPQELEKAIAKTPEKREELKKAFEGKKALREAIERTPENSIFFYADGQVQHLGFDEIYLLDKKASKEANNLVLNYQGPGPFARKILSLEEKKPRVAIAVVHEVLGLDGSEDLGVPGLKKVLKAHGFQGQDLLLKKWSEFAPPEHVVRTNDENRFENIEEQLDELEMAIKTLTAESKELADEEKLWKAKSLAELNKLYGIVETLEGPRPIENSQLERLKKEGRRLRVFAVDEEYREYYLRLLSRTLKTQEMSWQKATEERQALRKEKKGLNVENLAELQRLSDLRAKMSRLLADVDLLIVPRFTLGNVNVNFMNIPNRAHYLDEAQLAAVKEFLKVGKPVLFCLGPPNEPAERAEFPEQPLDGLEKTLAELGIKMPKQTILFNVEAKSFAERRSGLIPLGTRLDLPPVEFAWPREKEGSKGTEKKPNPVRTSLHLAARRLSEDKALDLRLRHPRPIYFEKPDATTLPFEPIFMITSAESWNEDKPFPTGKYTPRFEKAKGQDPARGAVDEVRRGPFPIGVALELPLPASWYGPKENSHHKVRLAVVGHGGVFGGAQLNPTREKVFLDLANWLLGRDDLLARENQTWEYPRIALGETTRALCQWGLWLGLPLLVVYLGMIMWLVRSLR